MKSFSVYTLSGWVRAAVVAGVGLGGVSCSLPPREAWQRMKEDGVLKAFFVPKRTGVTEDRTQRLAGADLSADQAAPGSDAGPPVAEPAGQPGYVYSPRTATRKLVNVKDFSAGETVLCPYTMEAFVVPGAGAPPATERLAEAPSFGPAKPAPDPVVNAAEPPSLPEENPVTGNPAVEELTPDPPVMAEADSPLLAPAASAPFGSWVADKPGHVYSPFAARNQLVDVTGIAPGTEVHCPFSGRIFRVPELAGDPHAIAQAPVEPPPAAPTPEDLAAAAPAPTEPLELPAPPADPAVADAAAMRELAAPAPAPTAPGSPAPGAPGPPKYGATGPAVAPPTPAPTAPVTVADPSAPKGDPKPKPSVKPAPAPELPSATWAPGKPGLVQSPFGKPGQLVDVTGKPTGSKVVCPYTNKPFLVPKP